MTRPLPPQRQKVMDYIAAELRAGKPFPDEAAVAKYMGWKNPTSARDAISKLFYYDHALERVNGSYQVRVG